MLAPLALKSRMRWRTRVLSVRCSRTKMSSWALRLCCTKKKATVNAETVSARRSVIRPRTLTVPRAWDRLSRVRFRGLSPTSWACGLDDIGLSAWGWDTGVQEEMRPGGLVSRQGKYRPIGSDV